MCCLAPGFRHSICPHAPQVCCGHVLRWWSWRGSVPYIRISDFDNGELGHIFSFSDFRLFLSFWTCVCRFQCGKIVQQIETAQQKFIEAMQYFAEVRGLIVANERAQSPSATANNIMPIISIFRIPIAGNGPCRGRFIISVSESPLLPQHFGQLGRGHMNKDSMYSIPTCIPIKLNYFK